MSFEFLISKIQKNNFLLIGRAGIDIYPDPPGTKTENAKSFVTHLGGSSANMGVQLTLFGGNCNLLTRVSDDALGKLAINQLNHYGVKNKLVEFEKNESRISFAIVETTVKDHQSIIYRHKASDLFLNKDSGEAILKIVVSNKPLFIAAQEVNSTVDNKKWINKQQRY